MQICEGRFPKEISIDGKRIYVVAYGKAVIGMVTALDSILGNRIEGGIASIPTNTIQELKEHGRRFVNKHKISEFVCKLKL